MKFLQHGLVVASLLPVLTSPASTRSSPSDSSVNWEVFCRLLDTLDEATIHSILHSLSPKFQHGIFSKDRSAIEHIHSENPTLASSLIFIAKRQSNATTTASTPAQSSVASVESSLSSAQASLSSAQTSLSSAQQSITSAVAAATTVGAASEAVSSAAASASSQAAAQSSAEASLTSAQGSLSSELAASSALTASTLPAPTTLGLGPSTPSGAVAIATTNGAVIFSSTNGGGLVTVASSTAFVTYSRESSEILSTYTLPNGQLTTATSFVVVNAPITTSIESAATGRAATTGTSAGLQSGAARATSSYLLEIAALVGGAALVAMAL